MVSQPSGGFGADDYLRCPNCNRPMHLLTRTPLNASGVPCEHQVFACICGDTLKRTVDEGGNAVS